MTPKKQKTEFNAMDVGKFFTTDGKDVWIMTGFMAEPQVWMKSVAGDEMKEGMVSEFADFVRLVPEADPPARPKRKYERKVAPVVEETNDTKV